MRCKDRRPESTRVSTRPLHLGFTVFVPTDELTKRVSGSSKTTAKIGKSKFPKIEHARRARFPWTQWSSHDKQSITIDSFDRFSRKVRIIVQRDFYPVRGIQNLFRDACEHKESPGHVNGQFFFQGPERGRSETEGLGPPPLEGGISPLAQEMGTGRRPMLSRPEPDRTVGRGKMGRPEPVGRVERGRRSDGKRWPRPDGGHDTTR